MNSSVDSEKFKHRHVGLKLLSYLLTFSFVITLTTFGFILLSDYKRGVNEYEQSSKQIQTSYQQSISYSLWNFDTRQIESQLEGILNFPGVVYVYIETQNNLIHSAGDVLSRTDKRHSFPLNFNSSGKEYKLGNLHIDINYTDLYEELQDKAFQILLTQFVKTFSVSIFLLAIVRVLITKRLKTMSEWAGQFSLDKTDSPLQLHIHSNERDELDLVAEAINKMRETIKLDMVEREKNRAQLEKTKEHLSIAVDNAALGLCQYNSLNDEIECNHHYAQLLGSTQKELEASDHPMEQFRELFHGEESAELREKFNQLLFGRINRLQTCLQIVNLNGEEKFLDTTIQIISYQENHPREILLCLVDKSKEQIASRQAQELTINLENKVAKRTEELYEEQQRAKANILKLTQQLERLQRNQSNQLNTSLNMMLLKYLQTDNRLMLDLIGEYLDVALNGPTHSIDLSYSVRTWLQQQSKLYNITIREHFPLSLILEENDQLLTFVLNCLIIKEPLLPQCRELDLYIKLTGESAHLKMVFTLDSGNQQNQQPEPLLLCEYIIGSQLEGEISRQLDNNQLTTEFSFSLNRKN